MAAANFIEASPGFYVRDDYAQSLRDTGIDCMESVFNFSGGDTLTKANLTPWRSRIRFSASGRGVNLYLKRYDHPPKYVQLRSWFAHGRRAALADFDRLPTEELAQLEIHTPETIAYGSQWSGGFERCSFIISAEIPAGRSLEQALPPCFDLPCTGQSFRERKAFIGEVASLVRRFHAAGYRHRDLYLAHIFLSGQTLYLIDLHRAFKPRLLKHRYTIKDLSQLHYSSPGDRVTQTDRLRFFRAYTGRSDLTFFDRMTLRQIYRKAWRMADHDLRHGRTVPFAR